MGRDPVRHRPRVGYADFADKLDVAELDAVLRGDTALKQLPRSKN